MTHSHFRLLVVRLGAMGDILHALPAVTALRLAHPEWVIDWVVEPRWRALLAATSEPGSSNSRGPLRPLVDRLYFASTREWRKAPLSPKTLHEVLALRSALKAGVYDAVLDLQGAVRSAVIARLAGCSRRIGEAEPREGIARWLFTERVETRGAHVIEQDVELASAVAADNLSPVQPWLPVDPAAEAWADELLSSASTPSAVLINPGAGWGAKRWPVERYAAVAQRLVERGCRVLVNAGPGEEPLAEVIAANRRRGHPPRLHARAAHLPHPPHCFGHCWRHRPAPSGLRALPSGGGHLRTHRPQPQRPLWLTLYRPAQPGRAAATTPATIARVRPAHHPARRRLYAPPGPCFILRTLYDPSQLGWQGYSATELY